MYYEFQPTLYISVGYVCLEIIFHSFRARRSSRELDARFGTEVHENFRRNAARWMIMDAAIGRHRRCHLAHIKSSIVAVLRKSIVHEVAITQRVRLDHVISRGCRQRQMTQLPFHGCSAALDRAAPPMFWDGGSTPAVLFLRSKVIGNARFVEKKERKNDPQLNHSANENLSHHCPIIYQV